jgi:hypothetical protein
MSAPPVNVVAEIHGFSEPDAGPEERKAKEAHGQKYGRQTWDYVVRDGAFAHRSLGGRAIVFRVRPIRGLGFRKGDAFSQTTWRFGR